MNLFQPSEKLVKTVRKGSRKIRLYDKPQALFDPFKLAETVSRKLERIWDLAHYRYKPKDIKKSTNDLRKQLSNQEKEILEEIAQIFGIEVYVRTHQNSELINIAHG